MMQDGCNCDREAFESGLGCVAQRGQFGNIEVGEVKSAELLQTLWNYKSEDSISLDLGEWRVG